MNFEEITVSQSAIYNGPIFSVEKHIVSLPDQRESFRDIIRHNGGVAVIAFTDDNRLVCVRQYRKAIEQTTVEIPAGKLDRDNEDLLSAIQRELEEETHYRASDWQYLTTMYLSPGISSEMTHIYVATGLQLVDNPLPHDEGEFVETLLLTYDEALTLWQQGEVCDAKTLYALQYWQLHTGHR